MHENLCPTCGSFVNVDLKRALLWLGGAVMGIPWKICEEDEVWAHEMTEKTVSRLLPELCEMSQLTMNCLDCPCFLVHRVPISDSYCWSLPHAMACFAFGGGIPTNDGFLLLNEEQCWSLVKSFLKGKT